MPVIYMDVLIAVNWFVDYWLLNATACILRLTPRHGRMVLASFIGAVCSGLLFICGWPLFPIIVSHFLLSLILVKTAFLWQSLYAFFKQTVVLYCMSAFFSGAITAICTVLKNPRIYAYNGVVYMDISPLFIAFLSVVSYVCIRVYEYMTRRRASVEYEYRLFLDDGNGVCECRALYDTGLHLTEPFSGKAVVVVEKQAIWTYLSQKTVEALGVSTVFGAPIRFIPYRSVGGEGLLPAFVPKQLSIQAIGGRKRDISGTYVAVSDGLGRGEYAALVGSDTVSEG